VHKSPNGVIAARSHHEQIERGAVERQLLDRVSIRRVRLDSIESGDLLAGVVDDVPNRPGIVDGRKTLGRKRNRPERRQARATLRGERPGDAQGVAAFR
jgi:hypothetical protein